MMLNEVSITGIGSIKPNVENMNKKQCFVDSEQYLPFIKNLALRNVDKISRMVLAAISKALISGGMEPGSREAKDCSIIAGTLWGALDSIHNFDMTSLEKGALAVNPSLFQNTVLSAPTCCSSTLYKMNGEVITLYNGGLSAIDSIGLGYRQIADEQADYVIAGGADELSELPEKYYNDNIQKAESSVFYLLEKERTNKTDLGIPDIAICGYETMDFRVDDSEQCLEDMSIFLLNALTNRNIDPGDVCKIYFTVPLDAGNSLDIALKMIGYSSINCAYSCSRTDWLGVNGAMDLEYAIFNDAVTMSENDYFSVVGIENKKISLLLLHKL